MLFKQWLESQAKGIMLRRDEQKEGRLGAGKREATGGWQEREVGTGRRVERRKRSRESRDTHCVHYRAANKKHRAALHTDVGNIGVSYVTASGDYVGGQLWVYDPNGERFLICGAGKQ